MTRVPIRLRLTLAFALAMAVVLAATGAFLYLRLSASLDEATDESLQTRASELVPTLPAAVPPGATITIGRPATLDPDERFVQLFDPDGRLVGGTIGLDDPLLARDALAEASRRVSWFIRSGAQGVDGRVRLLATPVERPNGTFVLVVGASLEDRDEAVHGLLVELLVVGPVALLLASLLGYGLATAALRPVEAMRIEATAISGSEPGRRLPLPSSQDEVRRLGETLNEMLERLERALERERGFVADAGHELRTPLAVMKAELELALRRPRTEAELEQAIRSAAEETDRLAQLAEDLLLITRSDQAQLTLWREDIPARDLLQKVATRFSHRARQAGRTIVVEAPDALELAGDAPRLEQALGNLVENALSHARGPVQLSAVDCDGRIVLHVRDAGGGFPPEFLPRAFDRFTRADDARTGNGTGLGLTIVEAIAKAHGGTAHAENRDDGGADVWLSLPRSGGGSAR